MFISNTTKGARTTVWRGAGMTYTFRTERACYCNFGPGRGELDKECGSSWESFAPGGAGVRPGTGLQARAPRLVRRLRVFHERVATERNMYLSPDSTRYMTRESKLVHELRVGVIGPN
eukprot:scaffold104667_cov72-Phaeocystis_antarctica.AAC.2